MSMPPHSFSYPQMSPVPGAVIPFPMYHAMVQQVFTQMMEAQGQDDILATPRRKESTAVKIEDKFTEVEL